ncbi:hypothetical protein A2380_02400 [candidate division WWE3 bacterium RIFOXYB1_FULL_43_24]|uniref:Baseplate protein J-like domain-containing protein n=1 Tax=candidate division WWE3 bacterium GW2011_GWF1_42_14 TaxID=1619138 RepID=A0A0G0YJW2_UNCKA|nr:MAG: hypothetical protein UU92_C0008G0005 [candidate division WWE3 bacterium GW2011_GWA1_42_12]KKS33742.1 MAG: hypothetical protein UU97_C0022G0004 [candidate division WWE3 bacterium GW2011_GWD1_42_14]KKS36904.1 MAG: hypothetical protein UV00_C0019G0005 [candidate division WWE3 bacterium GW2011_GWF1_42_14]KKS39777.1 MAG: hypothetical protein UV03_C0021G0004 [candidate division WWE3 bacterium GW2011_GWE1_42_16]OGC68844.1 MAG: hypothetical protein A2380_02400 [candidate division WWE3 bacterium
MTKLELEVHDDALSTINKIKHLNDSGIELIIPEGSILFDNIISLKLISRAAEKNQKIIQFTTNDETGASLVNMLEEPSGQSGQDYQPREVEQATLYVPKKSHFGFKKPAIPHIKFPKFKSGAALPVIILAILFGTVFILSKKPVAYAKVVLNSLPLTRSTAIKVKSGGTSDAVKMELKGQTLDTNVEITDEVPTTGEKLVGKKADGEAIIYNKTVEEIKLEKGSKLNYDEKDLVYVLSDDVTVPARVDDLVDPSIIKPGEATVKITAADIGSDYNIDANESLEVDDYKSSEMAAKTKDDLSGGESKKVKVVAEADKTALQTKVTEAAKEKAESDLKFKLGKTQRLIEGSVTAQITKEAYSAEVGDEAEKLTLTAYASASGLTYMESDLNSLLDQIVQNLVPQGHVLSEKQREISALPLGNSSSSILNSTEADMQITLKTFTVTAVDKEELKKALAGKSLAEAEKVLGSVGSLSTYSIEIKPVIPFFKNVPKDLNRINLEIENE